MTLIDSQTSLIGNPLKSLQSHVRTWENLGAARKTINLVNLTIFIVARVLAAFPEHVEYTQLSYPSSCKTPRASQA